MKAIARKVHLHPEVELEKWAERTEGFSGADLQALLYNAHLEAIHESISAATEEKDGDAKKDDDAASDGGLRFTTIGAGGRRRLGGAERQALTRKLELVLKNSQSKGKQVEFYPRISPTASTNKERRRRRARARHWSRRPIWKRRSEHRPSVPLEEQRRLRGIYRTFAGDRDGNFPDGEASTQIGARSSLM